MDIEKIKTEAFTMGSKLQAIKHIKCNTGLSLKDSKKLFEKWEYEGMRLPDSYMEHNNLFEQMGNLVKSSNYDIIVAQRDELLKENALLKEQNSVLKEALKPLANLDLTGVNGEIVYVRDKTQITVTDVKTAKKLLTN